MRTIKIYERIDLETFLKNSPFYAGFYSNDYLKSCNLETSTDKFDLAHNQLALGHFIDKANTEDLSKIKLEFEKRITQLNKELSDAEQKVRNLKETIRFNEKNQASISMAKTYKQAFEILCSKD